MEGQHLNSELREFSSFYKSLGTWTEIMEEKKTKTNQSNKKNLTISFPPHKHETHGPNSQQ